MDIMQKKISSNFLAANSTATHKLNTRAEKMMMKHQGVVRLFLKLGNDAPAAKTFVITHLDDAILCIFSEENILLMIQAAASLFNNNYKPAPFHAHSFYRHAWASLLRFIFATSRKSRRSFPPSCCFLRKLFSKRRYPPARICLCSSVFLVLWTTMQGTNCKSERGRLKCGKITFCSRLSPISVQRRALFPIKMIWAIMP